MAPAPRLAGRSRCYDPFVNGRDLAAARSRALHEAVARRVAEDPSLVARARARVRQWGATGAVARPYVEAWQELLDQPLPELLARLVEPSERMHELRQVSPFAGVLDPRLRWRILRDVRSRTG